MLHSYDMFAQKEAYQWPITGGFQLDFSSSPPQFKKQKAITSRVAYAPISDRDGNLLFFSDGENLYDASFKKLALSNELKGLFSCAYNIYNAACISFSTTQFFLFTRAARPLLYCDLGGELSKDTALYMHDIRLENGVLTLQNSTTLMQKVNGISGMGAVKHKNGVDTWLIAGRYSSLDCVLYLIGECGVLKTIYPNLIIPPDPQGLDEIFSCKFSTKGDLFYLQSNLHNCYYKFDNETGDLQLLRIINNDALRLSNALHYENASYCYGTFSLSSDYFYTLAQLLQGSMAIGEPRLLRYKLSDFLYNATIPMPDSYLFFNTVTGAYPPKNLQMAPDGRIYFEARKSMAKPRQIYAMKDPEALLEEANLDSIIVTKEFQELGSGGGVQQFIMMPSFVESFVDPAYVTPPDPAIRSQRVCFQDSASFSANTNRFSLSVQNVQWDFGDGTHSALLAPEKANSIVKHKYSRAGIYNVRLLIVKDCGEDVLSYALRVDNLAAVSLGSDTSMCEGSTLVLDAGANYENYEWSNGNTAQITMAQPQHNYAVTVSNTCNSATDEVYVDQTVVKLSNLITPNGDGLNDVLHAPNTPVGNASLEVYNSWGTRVFFSEQYQNNWPAPRYEPGIYYYQYKYSTCPLQKGWVQILH